MDVTVVPEPAAHVVIGADNRVFVDSAFVAGFLLDQASAAGHGLPDTPPCPHCEPHQFAEWVAGTHAAARLTAAASAITTAGIELVDAKASQP